MLLKDIQALPARSRSLLLLNMVNNLGSGLITPFLVVYVHQVNGLPLTVATTAMATMAVGVMLGALFAGWLTDRRGAEFTVVLYMLVQAAGLAGYSVASLGWHFLAAAAIVGLGVGGSAAWNAMLAESAPKEQHPTLFSVNFTGANVALGIGGLLGSVVAAQAEDLVFRGLYVADALSCAAVGLAFVKALRSSEQRGEAGPRAEDKSQSSSYTVVLRHTRFMLLLVLGGLLFCASYGQLESGFPAHLTADLGVKPSFLGLLFVFNTGFVVLGQLMLHKVLKSVRPDRLVAAAAVLWAVSWGLIRAAGPLGEDTARFAILVAAISLFGIGEVCFAAGMPTLVNSLAPVEARGRFNAAYSMSISFGFIVGPIVAGASISAGAGGTFVTGLAVGCLLLAILFFARGRSFTPSPPAESPAPTEIRA
ncbi:MFS transporter [Streptomyces sp. NPDC002120]|uniref:MFS transporter n=1 Tax=Streptomyces sp. NPDC002120 TaxID=3364631 RepID=UPI0036B1AC81